MPRSKLQQFLREERGILCWLVLRFHSTESFSWLGVPRSAGALPNRSLTNPTSPCGVASWALLFLFRDSERCPLQNLLLTASSRTGLKSGNERAKASHGCVSAARMWEYRHRCAQGSAPSAQAKEETRLGPTPPLAPKDELQKPTMVHRSRASHHRTSDPLKSSCRTCPSRSARQTCLRVQHLGCGAWLAGPS